MFQGYSDETFEFFMAIRFNNNRSFFLDNRDWYLCAVREPSIALAEELESTVEDIDPELERRPHRVVSRINRDIRFSKDKSPYRDYIWLAFRRPAEERGTTLGVYFDISDKGASCGMGFYKENRVLMDELRRKIQCGPQEMLNLYIPQMNDFKLYAEPNRRIKVQEGIPDVLIPWYTAKGFYFEHEINDFDLIRSPQLAEEIKRCYRQLKPLYRCIIEMSENI